MQSAISFCSIKRGHGNVSCYTNTSLFVWVDQIKILYIVSNVYSRSQMGLKEVLFLITFVMGEKVNLSLTKKISCKELHLY